MDEQAAAKDDKYGVSISLNGWKNIVKQNILGLVITRSDKQTNLCVADIFKLSPKLLKTSKNTIAIIKYFNASLKFTKDLCDEQKRIYNKYITLIQLDQTLPVENEEIDNSIVMEPPELNINDFDNKSNDKEVDKFIKL
ncbi:hypothetical protein RhiirB3_450997 [Rhizophagus irregularis]|nr:hypothetical protein RhiirB3_450997 [Rhizophagus irregularis]